MLDLYVGMFLHALHVIATSDAIAALSSASMPVWYKALFEILVQAWEAGAQQLSADQTADKELLDRAALCAKGFALLIQVTKIHQDKQVLLHRTWIAGVHTDFSLW